ncbi:MAG: DNA mismatch repair protein MutS [Clostridia bacterium]|nr:DNA mismatch repair protein MutS [Clostridia bacterium]
MMEQYFEIKNKYKDFLLFYRLGDFYEMFFDDAILASRELELTLTGRDCGEEERAPMCGVPYHSSETYIGKLIEKGYKVAICEQMEDPALAKGLVRRDVTRIVTPGTLIESNLLNENQNNYLCAVCFDAEEIGVCFADVSTGQAFATSFIGKEMISKLNTELSTYMPSEIIVNISLDTLRDKGQFIKERVSSLVSDNQSFRFDYNSAYDTVRSYFESERSAWDGRKPVICSIGALLHYLAEMQKTDNTNIKDLKIYTTGQFMEIDVNSRRNLELCETMRTKEKRGSLLWVLDKTKTAPGARMLRQWVEHPLLKSSLILRRQSAVEELYCDFIKRQELEALLNDVLDLERLLTKIIYGTANGKDLRAVCNTISVFPEIKALISDCKSEELKKIFENFDTLSDIYNLIQKSIKEDAPFSVRDGGIILEGYNSEVDNLRSIMTDGHSWIEKITQQEREATGIKTLKINYNKVFGYYIEVTKSLIDLVPDTYIRKQTLSNCERYITQELKDIEATILGAADKVCALEYNLFQEIRQKIAEQSERIRKSANLVATIDVYNSLAAVAAKNNYVKPEIDDSNVLDIKDGRHPVVEQFVKDTYFVPNDVYLDISANRLMLITGPNMAGKSTYMRQVALIVVMAQIGSFVPASDARIGIVDKVFTRVGASDDLASGQSTFMLEMNEVAYILRNATQKSLIIYDEVGRGTSTFDGMSIARAIIEYTNGKKIGAKTLFATHYHELTSMEDEFNGIVNYNIAAKKRGDDIIFLRKIIRGSTDDSYGIEVAKLAGLPNEVIKRAKEVLATVEKTSRSLTTSNSNIVEEKESLITFEEITEKSVIEDIKKADVNSMTPVEAMNLLFELNNRLK